MSNEEKTHIYLENIERKYAKNILITVIHMIEYYVIALFFLFKYFNDEHVFIL